MSNITVRYLASSEYEMWDEFVGISPLAFALGMYLPIGINVPIIIGAAIAHFVKKSGKKDEVLGKARHDKGTLIASGMIAGGALMGVFSSLLSFIQNETGVHFMPNFANDGVFGNYMGIIMFALLCFYIYWHACKVKKDEL